MKRALVTCLQAAVTILLLWWIFRDPEKRAMMWATLRQADWRWFLPGLLAVGLAMVMQTWRWLWLLGVHGIHPSWFRVFAINLIGMFFSLFLPGGTGGDLIKMYFAGRESGGKKAAAVLSVIMDRVVGLFALIALAAVISAMAFRQLWEPQQMQPLLLTLGIVLAGALSVVLAAFLVESFHLSKRIPHWLPLRHAILELAAAFSTYTKSPGALLSSLLISIPSHFLFFLSFFCAAKALNQPLSFLQLATVLPIILTISALPISVAGLGVREQLFGVCLGALYGTRGGIAELIGFSGFLLNVAWSVVGGILFIFYRSSRDGRTPIARMGREIEQIEEEIETDA